mmetsp:Transcript_7310/g.22292  ORF Transcript_7310/g.22292 Transcript_7310/m.22292 type:complete len:295 (-) Transcript_7310:101-985(-)
MCVLVVKTKRVGALRELCATVALLGGMVQSAAAVVVAACGAGSSGRLKRENDLVVMVRAIVSKTWGSLLAAKTGLAFAPIVLWALVRDLAKFAHLMCSDALPRMATPPMLIPRLSRGSKDRKVLVLDLDETLIHAHHSFDAHYDTVHSFRVNGKVQNVCINFRPHLDFFLRTVAKWFDVYIFTSARREYADPLINMIDRENVVSGRFFRESCVQRAVGYVKDLTLVDRDLSRVVMVDNNPISYILQEANGVSVSSFTDSPFDEELLDLLPLLHNLSTLSDVRSLLSLRLSGGRV